MVRLLLDEWWRCRFFRRWTTVSERRDGAGTRSEWLGGAVVCGPSRGTSLREHGKDVGGIWTWTVEVFLDHRLERFQGLRVDIEFPFEITTHLPFHLVDFAKIEHSLGDDSPGFVGVGIVAHDLRCDHIGGNIEPVTGRAASSGETSFEALEKYEGSESD
jgi:hypothetical protein